MRLYFDTRLGYLVQAPGQTTQLTELALKAGDTPTIEIEFGESADPAGTPSFISGSTWTKQILPTSPYATVITIGVKEDGDYGDGTLLAGTSAYTYADYLYTFSLSLNTTALNTAMDRDDDDDTNDVASLETSFEVTYQPGGSGGWLSSIYPITLKIYNDVLIGDESSPVNAASPSEYYLKSDFDYNDFALATDVGDPPVVAIQVYTGAEQALTTSYADVSGSSISYTPTYSSSLILYEFNFSLSKGASSPIAHFDFYVDAAKQSGYDKTEVGSGDSMIHFTGAYTNSGTSALAFKMQAREYSGSHEAVLHALDRDDGSAGSSATTAATLKITEVKTA